MVKKFRRPPQGTMRIISRAEDRRVDDAARRRILAAMIEAADPDFAACAIAKRDRDYELLGRLIPTLRTRYGNETFEAAYMGIQR